MRDAGLSPEVFTSLAGGPRHEVPVVFVSMKPVQAAGSFKRRSVWPVGAVSKMTWAKSAVVRASRLDEPGRSSPKKEAALRRP